MPVISTNLTPIMTHPVWTIAHKKKETKLRCIRDKYYPLGSKSEAVEIFLLGVDL
jgi:hypothetical protein